MEEEANATRYWCHMCSQTVNAVVMEDEIKCTLCRSGFIEEMDHSSDGRATNTSIWDTILMEMMNSSSSSSATRRNQSAETENEPTGNTNNNGRDLALQLQEILRTRRGSRPSVSVLQLLHGVRSLEPESSVNRDDDNNNNNNGADGERGRSVILIDPLHQIIAIPSSLVRDSMPAGSSSLSDYFIGPGFEALLHRLAENDPNRYGTPPARKEDVESLATVKIQEPCLQCSVCLDDFEVGIEAKQMPCKHNFHADCLLPWLELHSSCPVCRYQLPTADETKTTDSAATNEVNGSSATGSSSQGTENSDTTTRQGEEEEEENDGGNRNSFSIPWPLSTLFSSSQGRNSSD